MTFLTPLCNSQKTHLIPVFFMEAHPVSLWSKVFDKEDYKSLQALPGQGPDHFLPLEMISPIYTLQPPERSHGLDSLGPWRTWVGTGTPTGLVDHPAWANTAHRRFWATITQETLAKSELAYSCHITAAKDTETQKISEDSFLDFQCGDLASKLPSMTT